MLFTSNFDPTIQTLQHKLRKQHFYSLRFPSFREPVCRLSFLLLADTSAVWVWYSAVSQILRPKHLAPTTMPHSSRHVQVNFKVVLFLLAH